jgi:alpha-ribazole phosphatase
MAMSALGVTRWWWLRHAPVPCPEGRIVGRLDVACDVSDVEDFAWLARQLPANAVLVESGLMRCRQTVGALESAGLMLPPPEVEADFAEQDFGHWQGRTWLELEKDKDPALGDFWRDAAETAPPGGESFADMTGRVAAAIERLNRLYAGRDIVAVAHAGTVRAALAHALDLDPARALRFVVQPLSLTRIDAIADGWRVDGVNLRPA